MSPATIPSRSRGPSVCPGCGRPAASQHTPFCSQGCRDRDLLQWLSDGHRIPGPPVDDASADFEDRGLDS